jgi:hypothetical protein
MEKEAIRRFPGMRCLTYRSLLAFAATGLVLSMLVLNGCGGTSTRTTSSSSQQEPQTYFAPWVAGTTNGSGSQLTQLTGTEIYAIDDTADAFSQSIFGLGGSFHLQGPQVINAGTVTKNSRGLLSLEITANYAYSSSSGTYEVTDYSPVKSGSFAFEISGQYGGLAQVIGQPAIPLVAASACPNLSTAQTWLFLTIPGGMTTDSSGKPGAWSPTTDTAYGSAEISTSGSTVTFDKIKQFTLPSTDGVGTPLSTATSPTTGICGSTTLGYATSVPGYAVITDPGLTTLSEPSATVGINSTGLLIEDNGVVASGTNAGTYENVLGAGTGAIGLPMPSSALDVSALRSAQYLGFVRGAGIYDVGSISGWSSHLASFGFPTIPSTCAAVATSTSTLLYGGDFTDDDPSTSSDGFGNCDLAIDLGTQDSANNGLFPNATVWLGANYSGNTTGITYSFSAVAIAGKLNGKYGIFLLGVDSTEPWTIYLLQSN